MDGTKYIISPYDEFAIEEAIKTKEKAGAGEVIVVSMGPVRCVEAIRTALAMGADRGIHIDDAGIPMDPYVTAKVLANALKNENPSVIFCGKQAIDDDAAQVPQMVAEFLKPLDMSRAALGLDAIAEVGPGGHFFGAKHTLERYQNAFYAPLISDWRNFQQWQAAGSPEAATKANALWKRALVEYQPPPLDAAIAEEIDAFVAKRIEAGGQPTDF